MKWQECAIQDLRKYEGQKESLVNIPEKILALRYRFQAVKSVAADREPVTGGASHYEDAMLDNIVERRRLSFTLSANKRLVALVEKGLDSLTKTERMVLDAFFINRRKDHIEYLKQETGYESAQIYRIKEDALYRFTVSMYGLPEY
ncbi:MAG: hypothetical protein ACK5JF_02735 [Oscillospiraceae bacterium]